jgi:hypothetical protein
MSERILVAIFSAILRPFEWWQRRHERRYEERCVKAIVNRDRP